MKKILAITLALAMLCTTMLTSFAAFIGIFVDSPSLHNPVEIIDIDPFFEFDDEDEHWWKFVVTSYGERETLSQERYDLFEESYYTVHDVDDLGDIIPGLGEFVSKNPNYPYGTSTTQLAVSDLFFTHIEASDQETYDGIYGETFTVTIQSDYLENFVALANYHDGEWRIIENAYINEYGNLVYSDDVLGPYAIIVNADRELPPTGDSWLVPAILVALIVVSGAAIAIIQIKKRKVC